MADYLGLSKNHVGIAKYQHVVFPGRKDFCFDVSYYLIKKLKKMEYMDIFTVKFWKSDDIKFIAGYLEVIIIGCFQADWQRW